MGGCLSAAVEKFRMRQAIWVFVGIVVIGCSGPPSEIKQAPPADVPPGSKLVEAGDISLVIPMDWEKGAMSGVDVVANRLKGLDEDGANILATYINVEERKVIGVPRTGVVIKKEPGGGNLETAAKTMGQFLMAYQTKEKMDLPIGSAYEFNAPFTTPAGDTIGRVVYVVSKGHDAYTLTFVSAQNPTGIINDARASIQTLRIKP